MLRRDFHFYIVTLGEGVLMAKPNPMLPSLNFMGWDSMALTARLAALICLSSALSYAENWTGALVDSNCYEF